MSSDRSWIVELDIAIDADSWLSNSLRFVTWDEADSYGVSLQSRWSAIRRFRVVEVSQPPNARFLAGVIYRL